MSAELKKKAAEVIAGKEVIHVGNGVQASNSFKSYRRQIMGKQALQFLVCCTLAAIGLSQLSGVGAQVLPPQPEPRGEQYRQEFVLYVSTEGSDEWSGRLADPAEDEADGPLATVGGAQERIRELKAEAGLEAAVTVKFRGGTYRQEEPLVFTPQDSGSECSTRGWKFPVTYAAYPGEEPVISGGKVIDGWEPADESEQDRAPFEGELWRTQVPRLAEEAPWNFNQLFVNGLRRTRARIPGSREFFYTDGPCREDERSAFFFNEGDLKEWDNLQDAIVVVYHSWVASVHHIQSVDTEANRVTVREPTDYRGFGNWQHRQRYYVENVFEGLVEPGEWYLDRDASTLYYCPMEDEDMASGEVEVVAPVITGPLVEFKGNPDEGEFVEYLHFRGLSFQHTNADLRKEVLDSMRQAVISVPALIHARGLRHSSFVGCEIAHSGGHGIWLAGGCTDNRIDRCHIHSLAGGGVYIGGTDEVHEATPTKRNTVNNSFIHDGSYLFRGANGVWIGESSCNTVTRNEISNFDWTGVSVGWRWGFGPTTANHNRIEYNHIHHIGNGDGLSDMGGIYTLGVSPGTTIRNNHIHDVYHYQHVSHGSGIYPDEGSSDILVENNVVYRVGYSPLFMHFGRDFVVRNNILALGDAGQLRRSREDRRCHFIAEGNIVYSDHPQMLDSVWENGDWELGRNVYWSTEGEPEFSGMDFESWREFGDDEDSIVADPLFEDPAAGDFRLRPDSPALELGFEPIDVDEAGLYGEPEWVNLPRQYPDRPIREVPPPE